MVIGVPDSGIDAAIGYARTSGIPYGIGFLKNKYIGRSFVEPSKEKRETVLRIKLNPIKEMIEGKRVVLVDDSVIRGSTMKNLVSNIRYMGAKEIHIRISSPTVSYECDFGVFSPKSNELIANQITLDKMADKIGADSICFISKEGMIEAFGGGDGFCTGCIDDGYPKFDKIDPVSEEG